MIFAEHKAIFIHNPKCGGTSICRTLGGQGNVDELNWHCPWEVHERRLSAEVIRIYYKFSFVRNPWDRLLSAYRWYRRGGSDSERDHAIGASLDRRFDVFVSQIERHQTCDVASAVAPFKAVPHFLPQSFMLGDGTYDFIGRFENFEDDVDTVLRNLGLTAPTIPHANRSAPVDYRSYYDDRTAEIVARVFRDDIERFSYTF